MRTDFSTLIALATHIINHLKQDELIDYPVEVRADLIESLATELGVGFSTDEDIRDQAIEDVEEKFGLEEIPDDITESEMFNHARKEIIKSYQGENLSGLYLVESLLNVAKRVKTFLLNSEHIDDVFGTDEDLVDFLIRVMRKFSLPKTQMASTL